MNVLVTGADGFVGQHVVAGLLDRGHEVVGGIRGADPAAGTLTPEKSARVDWRDFDLRDPDAVESLVSDSAPEAVIHLAGLSSVSESWKDPETTFDVNATGALRLLRALRRLSPSTTPRPVLLVSSGEVYGADGTEEKPLTEDLPLRPVTPYGASKAAQEMIASALGRGDATRLIQTRSFQQIGPGQRETFVTVNWARQLLDIRDGAQPPVLHVGNLDIRRDFLDVRDATAAYITLLETPDLAGVFNVCSGRSCSLRELLQLLQDAVGVSPEIRVDPERLRPAEITSLVGSRRKLSGATGWAPRYTLQESVRTLVEALDRDAVPAAPAAPATSMASSRATAPAPRAAVSRTDTSDVEPRYLALLEAEREKWWDSANFDTWKNLYVSEYARGHYVVDTLRKYLPDWRVEEADVLDVGCGDAGVPIAFAEAGARAAGIEPHEPSIRRGRVRAEEHGVDVDLRHGVAEELPYAEESFDLVILDNVLEHVRDQDRTLTEIRRVLRPDGLLYLVTPKPLSLYSLWNDPHYDLAGLVLLPRRLQVWYFEKVRGGGEGTYDVGTIPTRWRLRGLLRRTGFQTVVGPRELWVHYLRERIGRPEEIRPGLKRRLAGWLKERDWPFENPVLRWFWDVAIGSNFFIVRRRS